MDNGIPPIMGLQMHNLASSSTVSTNDQNTTNGNHNEIIPTESMHSDINISLVDNRNVTFMSSTNGGLNRTILSRIRRGIRYLRSGRTQNLNSGDNTTSTKA